MSIVKVNNYKGQNIVFLHNKSRPSEVSVSLLICILCIIIHLSKYDLSTPLSSSPLVVCIISSDPSEVNPCIKKFHLTFCSIYDRLYITDARRSVKALEFPHR